MSLKPSVLLTSLLLLGVSTVTSHAQTESLRKVETADTELTEHKTELITLGGDKAQAKVKTLNKAEVLKLLEDAPHDNEADLITDSNFTIWLIRTELFDSFNTILKTESFRNDFEIRSRLLALSKNHPFTDVRASARLVLSDFQGNRVPSMFRFSRQYKDYDGLTAFKMNEHMEYCSPPPNAKQPDFEIEAEAVAKTSKRGRPAYRFKVPTLYGSLSGGYYSIQGVGLTYQQDKAPDKKIGISSANNRYIMPSNSIDSFWLIDGPHHMIGGASITKLVETQDGINRYMHRVLPSGISQIFELPNGSIFINFVNLDDSKRGGTSEGDAFTPSPLELYNPPIILHPNGKIKLACLADAVEY